VPEPGDDNGRDLEELRLYLLAEIRRWAAYNPQACRRWLSDPGEAVLSCAEHELADQLGSALAPRLDQSSD
jgi:hypothetical protein